MKIKSKRIISAFLVISTLFGGMPNLSSMAATKNRDPYGVIDNNNPINNGYDFLMQSDEPLKIRKRLLGDNISIPNMVGTYGTLQDNGDYFIYNLNDFLNGVEEFNIVVDGKSDLLRIVPAYKMVYDEDFSGIKYSGQNEKRYDLNFYGRSTFYIQPSESKAETISFNFSGTGIELWSKISSLSSGFILYEVSEKNNNSETYDKLVSYVLDIKGEVNAYRQRVFSLDFEEKNISKNLCITIGKGQKIYADYFMVLNPLGTEGLPSFVLDLYERLNLNDFDKYKTHYIDKEDSTYKIYAKHLVDPGESSSDIIFENLEGKYGRLVEQESNGSKVYRYELNDRLYGIDEFKYAINGVKRVLRIVPLLEINEDETKEVYPETLERKIATSNLDIYIKSENMLSLSLDTNSVTFEEYSGAESMEKLGAVNITISSSLPYSLNAYIPTEISNSDGSEKMPIDILNIRESNEGVYKQFEDTTNKVVLKENCQKGNNINHSIDLKLDSSDAHVADIYKTVIKFEAEQK